MRSHLQGRNYSQWDAAQVLTREFKSHSATYLKRLLGFNKIPLQASSAGTGLVLQP